jgi:hypothetical protein
MGMSHILMDEVYTAGSDTMSDKNAIIPIHMTHESRLRPRDGVSNMASSRTLNR